MPEPTDKVAAIREIYFRAKPATIERDIVRAIELLKSMASEEERERAAVFMEGLAEMRAQWKRGETERN
jgi:hypothetical protein